MTFFMINVPCDDVGMTINLCLQDRQTSLMLASENGHEEIVSILLSAGAQVNLQDYVSSIYMYHIEIIILHLGLFPQKGT